MTRAFLILLLTLAGCATRSKTYQAPDASAMLGSARRIGEAVDKARTAAASAKAEVAMARHGIESEKQQAGGVRVKLDELLKISPAELRPLVEEAIARVDEMGVTRAGVAEALGRAAERERELETALAEGKAAQAQHTTDMASYREEAAKLAEAANADRGARIKAETSLSWYRWHWWGSWIVLGLGAAACGFFAFLKFTGRLALSGAAFASKL